MRAEFRRTFYHRSSLVFIGTTLLFCILSLIFQITGMLGSTERKIVLRAFQDIFAFPNSIVSALEICRFLFLFIIPTAVGYFVGADYQLNTWKMILPRTPQRSLLLICKILNISILLSFLFIIVFASVLISGVFGAFWLETSIFQSGNLKISIENQATVLGDISFIFWYISVAVLITIISRSIIIAAFATFVFYIFCNLIQSYSTELISIWFAPTHFGNLIPKTSTRPNVSSLFSWVIIIVHITANFVVSFIVLKKQDFSSK